MLPPTNTQTFYSKMQEDFGCTNLLMKHSKSKRAIIPSLKWFNPTAIMLGESVGLMVLNATFNNITVILWRAVILVKETRVPGENNRPVTSH